MHPALRKRFDRLERQRAGLLQSLAALDQEGLSFRPAPGAWSALDVVEHLVIAEELTVGALEKNKVAVLPARSRLRTDVTLQVVFALFAARRRLRAPVSQVLPSGQPYTLAALAARWGEARCRTAGLLEPVGADRLGDRIVRHPIAGWLTRPQMLDFHRRHVHHHGRQIARLRRARAFPG